MALELSERRKIAKYQGKLVESAEEIVKNSDGIWEKLEDSQFRNVAAIAASAECVPVVTNFIKYQRGRKKEDWNHSNFGEHVINKMNSFKEKAKDFSSDKNSEEKLDEIWIELCRSFWGYVIRYVKFKSKGGQD